MGHGGDIYRNKVNKDFSVSLNPLGTPEVILDALKGSLDRIEYYPDPLQEKAVRIIADAMHLDADCVYAGNGASELIFAAVRAADPGRALLFEPAFPGYRHALEGIGCETVHHILSEDSGFALTPADLKALKCGMDLVFLCDPANPSGRNIDESILTEVLDTAAGCKAAVILDESFYHMSGKMLEYPLDRSRELLSKYDNLYIIRSLTKLLAVPGIRTGYVLSSPANMKRLKRQLPEWNLSVSAESVVMEGIRAIKETDLLQRTADIICKERDYLSSGLKQLGFRVCQSDTSFILFKGPERLYEALLEQGILIRDCSDFEGLCRGWYRVSARRRSDNEYLIQTMRGIMNEL